MVLSTFFSRDSVASLKKKKSDHNKQLEELKALTLCMRQGSI